MGLIMLGTLKSFYDEKDGFIAHFAGKTSGATVSFIAIFSLIICLISACGVIATAKRDNPSTFNSCYGVCLFFFGFIPLVAVSDALLGLGTISQSDLVAACYHNVHNTSHLQELALPMGAIDVTANEGQTNAFSRHIV
jgi:hypothetical protein